VPRRRQGYSSYKLIGLNAGNLWNIVWFACVFGVRYNRGGIAMAPGRHGDAALSFNQFAAGLPPKRGKSP